jgi:hypothetical protein
LLEGKNVNLRVMEREDIDFLAEHLNDINEKAKKYLRVISFLFQNVGGGLVLEI